MSRQKGSRKKNIQPTPKSLKDGFHLNDKFFSWSFEKSIWEHDGWRDCKDAQFFVEHIISKLQKLESVKWQEILNASGGKSVGHGNNNHFILGMELPTVEKEQFIKQGYMRDFERVFSLRLSGKERLIGVVDLNVFKILWYDKEHRFF